MGGIWDAIERRIAKVDAEAATTLGYRDGWHLAHTIILATYRSGDDDVVDALHRHAGVLEDLGDRLAPENVQRDALRAQAWALRDAAKTFQEAA